VYTSGPNKTRLVALAALAGLAWGGVATADSFNQSGNQTPPAPTQGQPAAQPGGQPQTPGQSPLTPDLRPLTPPSELTDPLTPDAGIPAPETAGAPNSMDPTAPRANDPIPDGPTIVVPKGGAPDPSLEAGPNADGSSSVKVSEYMTVDLFVQDEDLATVLQMLSVQSQRNIVASRDVVATVSANLYGVTFYEALDAILHVNGYGYIEKGNFIYVYPADVIAQIEAKERRMESRVIQLNYLNANDAAEFVSPLLSKDGQIKTNGDPGDFNLPQNTPTGNEEFALASTLVIYDFPEHVEEIVKLLGQLDTRPSQVLVEATILQSSLNEANAFGVNFAVIADVQFTDFLGIGGPLRAAQALSGVDDQNAFAPDDNKGFGLNSNNTDFNKPGSLKIGLIEDDFSIFIRALDEVSDTTVISNPKILALNRQPARVLVGRKLGYLNTTTTDTATTQSVEFLDTGTALNFRPFVSNDGMIRMELAPSVSEGFIRDSTDSTGAQVTIPDELTQEITTNVMVPDGATVVLGGLFRESTRLQRTQVPFLGDIPFLGTAFRGNDDQIDRSEIIFMIKPTIMRDSVLAEQGDRAMQYAGAVRAGTRQGLLPFSRERQTAQLNVEAENLAAQGKWSEAMWSLRRSLELNPNQPDAISLRERLFNQNISWPSRNALNYLIDGEANHDIPKWPSKSQLKQEHGSTEAPATSQAPASNQSPNSGATAVSSTTSAAPAPMPEWLESRSVEIDLTQMPEYYETNPAGEFSFDQVDSVIVGPVQEDPQIVEAPATQPEAITNYEAAEFLYSGMIGLGGRFQWLLSLMGMPISSPAIQESQDLPAPAEMATVNPESDSTGND